MAQEAKYKVIITDSYGNEYGSNFVSIPYATTSHSGTIKIATDEEAQTGTETTKAVTPSQLNTLKSSFSQDVVTSISYSYSSSDDKSYIVQTSTNLVSGDTTTTNIELPLATSTQSGLMSISQLATLTSALQSSDITTGTENGTISVKGSNIPVYGLTETAYTEKSFFAEDSKVIHNSGDQALDGSLTLSGNVIISGDLNVSGTTTTTDAETLAVKDNLIITNSEGATLTNNSGLAIRTGTNGEAYAIVYDPTSTVGGSVKLGLGTVDDNNEFTFNEGDGSPVATRADSTDLTDQALMAWDGTNYKLVDSGVTAVGITSSINEVTTNLTSEIASREVADAALQSDISDLQESIDNTVVKYVSQELTEDQQLQARTNIDASSIKSITFTIGYLVSDSLTNCTASENNDNYIEEKGSLTLNYESIEDYALPSTVTITGATYSYDYNQNRTTGEITLSNPTSDVSIIIDAVKWIYPTQTNFSISVKQTYSASQTDDTLTLE